MPEITAIITAYNLEQHIENCLGQLRGQTFQDFEVIVIDDCSTDRTMELARSSMINYPVPICVIASSKNQGSPGKARNFALDSSLVHGRYLIFLDGDDGLEPNFLEKLHSHAAQTGAEITLCAYDRVEEETGHVLCREMRGFPEEINLPPKNDILAFINGSLWNKLILTSLIGETRFPDFRAGEDLCFQLDLFDRCHKIACVDEILIHYRVRASSVISNLREETVYQFAKEILRLRERTDHSWMKDTLAVLALIHIGISMPLRADHNPQIKMEPLLRWISDYFSQNFEWFRNNRWLKLRSLAKHGIKGLGLWCAILCYRLRCFPAFLRGYIFLTEMLRIDIKY